MTRIFNQSKFSSIDRTNERRKERKNKIVDIFSCSFREKRCDEEFEGPLRYVPSSFDNYGCDHSHSLTLSLETRQQSIMMLTRNRFQLDQCLILSKQSNEHYLFTIDSIQFGENRRITQMIADPFTLNRSYLVDHQGNVYLIEYPWIEQIENLSTKTFSLTNIQTLIVNSDPTRTILHIGVVRRNQSQTSLAVIIQSENDQTPKVFSLLFYSIGLFLKENKCENIVRLGILLFTKFNCR